MGTSSAVLKARLPLVAVRPGAPNKPYPLLAAAPAIAIYGVFFLASVVGGLVMSFSDWRATSADIHFVGLENFVTLFQDQQFVRSIGNTAVYAISTSAVKLMLGVGLALALNQRFRGRDAFRAVFFLPYVLSAYAIGYAFTFVFHPSRGLLTETLTTFGLSGFVRDWLGDPAVALWSLVGVDVWIGTGFCAALVLAGLQAIPTDVKEAAAVDGAGPFSTFWHITRPFLLPALSAVLTLNIIWGFRVFDVVQALTKGGPGWATEVVSTMLYKSQGVGALGYSAAIGLTQFVLVALAALPLLAAIRRREITL